MSRRRNQRTKRDEARAQARERRRDQAERTKAAEPLKVDVGNGKTFECNTTSDIRMLVRAIDKGWIKEALTIGPATMLQVLGDSNKSDRARAISSRELRGYLSQMMEAEREDRQGSGNNIQVNVGVNANSTAANMVQVKESDDWYGTQPAAIPDSVVAESNGAPTANPLVAGPIQSSGVRAPVGQNGVGTNGHSKGPRSLPGPT